jgi:hypothetical protein
MGFNFSFFFFKPLSNRGGCKKSYYAVLQGWDATAVRIVWVNQPFHIRVCAFCIFVCVYIYICVRVIIGFVVVPLLLLYDDAVVVDEDVVGFCFCALLL